MTSTPPYYSHAATTGTLSRRTGSIMLVDDEPALRTVGRAILSTFEVRVITSSSGEDALALLEVAKKEDALPNVILLDLTMPGGMSGLETFEQIKAQYPSLPVIACSGYFGEGAAEMILKLGFAGMLPKPHTPDTMITLVRRVLMRVNGEA